MRPYQYCEPDADDRDILIGAGILLWNMYRWGQLPEWAIEQTQQTLLAFLATCNSRDSLLADVHGEALDADLAEKVSA